MVRLVVEHHDLLLVRPEVAQDAAHHRLRRLLERVVLAVALQQEARVLRDALDLLGVLELEGVVVRDHDARMLEAALEVGGDQVAQVVVVLGILGQQHAEPVADRDARA